MNFTKLQGAGNDFILVETKDTERDWPQMARTMCDRHFGIGADGLLLLLASDIADFQMRMFNPDGLEAEACGNGLRCLAKYIVDRGLQAEKSEEALPLQNQIFIETIAGIRMVRLNKIGESIKIQVGMGTPKFGASDIPVVISRAKET